MRVTLAAYVYVEREDGRAVYVCQCARSTKYSTRDPLLSTAMSKLGNKLRKSGEEWIRAGNAQKLNSWLYDPKIKTQVCKLQLTLRDRTLALKLLLVCQPTFGRIVVYSPAIEGVEFEIASMAELENRSIEVYTKWAQDQISGGQAISVAEPSEMWIEPVELELETQVDKKKRSANVLAALMGSEKMSGSAELRKVGQCLDETAADFPKVLRRDELVDETDVMLSRGDQQGVLVVGARSVGKTAIIQECARRRMLRHAHLRGTKPQVWWLSPQRLVSGMSYLGQWEERWISILREASKRDHILYFDDLLGLFSAGKTRDCNLSAADVLRSYWAEHRVRILAEITEEQLAILRRRDRALADRFHLVHVPSWAAEEALPIVLESAYELQQEQNCHFHAEVFPLIMRHQEIYAPDRAFPGKAIEMCRAIAKNSHQVAGRVAFLRLAGRQAGTNLQLLLGRLGDRDTIAKNLSEELIGQPEAVAALSKVAIRFSQHLQAPDRPLGVLLFLGPTGVGKTESAKALTRLLYTSDDEKFLVRIDMNELTSPLAVEQLVGTFEHPEGRLTSAIRRRPNCVLLLDEIEKAHPDVFDLLLQVMGEGRLTDSRGRVADFRSSVIVLTSNLGAKEQGKNLGFESSLERRTAGFQKAAREFFRPEFINRIDEIVAFRNLTQEDMADIVRLQMQEVLARDGFKRRDVFVSVADSAIDRVILSGYDPQLGARAIRRKIEREVIGPLGDCLSAIALEKPALVKIVGGETHSALQCEVTELETVQPEPKRLKTELAALVEAGENLYDRWNDQLHQLREPLREADKLYGEAFEDQSYYALREQLVRCEEWLALAQLRLEKHSSSSIAVSDSNLAKPRSDRNLDSRDKRRLIDDQSFRDMRAGLGEFAIGKDSGSMSEAEFAGSLIDCFALTGCQLEHAMRPRTWLIGCREWMSEPKKDDWDEAIPVHLDFDCEFLSIQHISNFTLRLARCLRNQWQYEVSPLVYADGYVLASGVSLSGLLEPMTGTYRVQFSDAPLSFVQLQAIEVPAGEQPGREFWKPGEFHGDMKPTLASLNDRVRQGMSSTSSESGAGLLEGRYPQDRIRGRIQTDRVCDFASGAEMQVPEDRWQLVSERFGPVVSRWWNACLPIPDSFLEIVTDADHLDASAGDC